MPAKRHLSLWFPRLAAERLMRLERGLPPGPFVVGEDQRGAQVISSLNLDASRAGLTPGQPLRDARAICAGLVARPGNRVAEAAFLTTLRRWAGKFTPWVAEEAPDGLILDITGCAHLFGGEEALAQAVDEDCARLGLTVRLGIADSLGAPMAMPESLALARQHVDELITIPDSLMADTMLLMRHTLNLVAEPACTASLAATLGPLRDRAAGKRIGVLACGSNIGQDRFDSYTSSASLPLPPG